MKFVFAVVMLAFAVGVQSSLIAHVAPSVSYVTSALHGAPAHGGWGAWGTGWGGHWGGPAAIDLGHGWGDHGHGWGDHGHGWAGHGWAGHPGISLAQGPGHNAILGAHDLGHGHGHDGVYVAKTRGAIHTAPLAGHINSATSLNVAAAPGTH